MRCDFYTLYIRWIYTPSQRIAKVCLQVFCKNLRLLIGLLSGHCKLNKQLYNTELVNSSVCRRYELEEETIQNIIFGCPALMAIWGSMLGDFWPDLAMISTISIGVLLKLFLLLSWLEQWSQLRQLLSGGSTMGLPLRPMYAAWLLSLSSYQCSIQKEKIFSNNLRTNYSSVVVLIETLIEKIIIKLIFIIHLFIRHREKIMIHLMSIKLFYIL